MAELMPRARSPDLLRALTTRSHPHKGARIPTAPVVFYKSSA